MNQPATSPGFDWNRPTIISALYIASLVLGITAIIGLVLAYLWKGEPHAPWEESHFRYHIRTFWIGLLWAIVAAILLVATLFLFVWLFVPLVGVWFVVRAFKSLMAAQRHAPIQNVETWLF